MGVAHVEIWCDGSGVPDGPGGYGVVLLYGAHRREISGALAIATNNRAELMAAIKGFEALTKPCHVTVHTDSRYVSDAFNQNWIGSWKRKRWKKVKNVDLWKRLLAAIEPHPVVRWEWIRGHAGHELNELCDTLAGTARKAFIDCKERGIPFDQVGLVVEDITYVEQTELLPA